MNIRCFLIASTLLLSACGSETEVQVTTKPAAPDTSSPAKAMGTALSQDSAAASESAESSESYGESVTETDVFAEPEVAELQTEQTKPLLPLGRLVGIVDTGDYKQATINNQGKVVRLREGDDWQGWTVDSISRKDIVISRNNMEYSLLLLSEFRSPEANQQVTQSLSDDVGDDAPVPQFTEEQLTELRSRLLMGRTE